MYMYIRVYIRVFLEALVFLFQGRHPFCIMDNIKHIMFQHFKNDLGVHLMYVASEKLNDVHMIQFD